MLENDIASSGNGAFDVLDPNERQILAQVYLDAVCCRDVFNARYKSNMTIDERYL